MNYTSICTYMYNVLIREMLEMQRGGPGSVFCVWHNRNEIFIKMHFSLLKLSYISGYSYQTECVQ